VVSAFLLLCFACPRPVPFQNMACPKHLEQSIATSLRQHLNVGKDTATSNELQNAFELSQEFSRTKFDILDQASDLGLEVKDIYYNASPAVLYEQALRHEEGSFITASGALSVTSGKKTGRSPKDKRIVEEFDSVRDIWWGKVNIKLEEAIRCGWLRRLGRGVQNPNPCHHLSGVSRALHAEHARPAL